MRALLCLLLASVVSAQGTAAAPDAKRKAAFDAVWDAIQQNDLGAGAKGVDWEKVRKTYEPKAMAATDDDAFYVVLNAMLAELGQSHCAALSPGTKPKRLKKVEDSGGIASGELGDPGIEVRAVEGQACIVSVVADSPAAKVGVKPGWILREVDGEKIEPPPGASAKPHERLDWAYGCMSTLLGDSGKGVKLSVAETPDAQPHEVEVGRVKTQTTSFGLIGHMPAAFSSRRLEGGLGYVRIGSFFMPVLEQYKTAVTGLSDAPGLVIDLRGNPGGMGALAGSVAGFLTKERLDLGTSHMKTAGDLRFPVFPRPGAFLGPVAILIDGMSASTSEILAAGLKECGRARVFGQTSAGAVLPSMIVQLPDEGILQFPMADFQTPKGVTLEGRGVTPDVEVWWTLADCRAGRDPILDAACKWLAETSKK